jgi:protein SCO1/2
MFVSLFAVGGVAYLQYSRVDKARRAPALAAVASALPIIGRLPDFRLTERSGKTVTLADLEGKVWVADFIFTYCGGPCPIMTRRMREFHQALERESLADVLTVSISVDPERDTPAVLTEYATMFETDGYNWFFLTGNEREILDLTIKGFKLAVEPEQGTDQLIHSTRFVLVDPQAQIRGYYEIVTDEEIEALPRSEVIDRPMNPETKRKLIADIRSLLKAEPQ